MGGLLFFFLAFPKGALQCALAGSVYEQASPKGDKARDVAFFSVLSARPKAPPSPFKSLQVVRSTWATTIPAGDPVVCFSIQITEHTRLEGQRSSMESVVEMRRSLLLTLLFHQSLLPFSGLLPIAVRTCVPGLLPPRLARMLLPRCCRTGRNRRRRPGQPIAASAPGAARFV